MKKIFWIAGEKSGDLHASYVIQKLNKLGNFHNYGVGGSLMETAGFHSLFEFSRFNVMGFVEVIKHLGFFLKVEKEIKEILIKDKPDLVVLVDYPGLNLRIAKIATQLGIKVLYYICPQFWAWKHKRVFKIKKYTDFVCCINPFEAPLLDEYEIPNEYVGHPVAEQIGVKLDKEAFAKEFKLNSKLQWIGLFPGSREMEVERHLPIFLQVAQANPEREYLISIIDKKMLTKLQQTNKSTNIKFINGYNYEIMKHSDFVVAKSGTTTLETTLFATPFVIVYKINPVTVMIARKIARTEFIGLPNLIANRLIVKELIQNEVNAENITNEINQILNNKASCNSFKAVLEEIKSLLGDKSASTNTAKRIYEMISNE